MAQKLKEEGNQHFAAGQWEEAISCYTKAIDLGGSSDQDLSVFYKNRAACSLKTGSNTEAQKDATRALELVPNDSKALFRRCQALEALGRLEEAYTDARLLLHLEPKNTAIQPLLRKITVAIQDRSKQQTSTHSKVTQMLVLAHDKDGDKEKRIQACNNLIVLSREEAGAQLILDQGLHQLSELLTDKDESILLAAIRILSCLCNNNKSRSRAVIRELGPSKWFQLICLSSEILTTAVTHMLQNIISSIAELGILHKTRERYDEKKRKDGPQGLGPYPQLELDEASKADIDSLFHSIIKLINNSKISAVGRDAAIQLIIKNITNKEGINWAKPFLETDGISRLLDVGGTMPSSEEISIRITESTHMHVSVALSKIYEDLNTDKLCEKYKDQCKQHLVEQFGDSHPSSQLEAIVAISTLLQGPYEVGNIMLSTPGVMEIMLEMAASDNITYQKVAVEALVHSASKKEKCSGMIKQAVPILKQLYHSKNENVKVRALVGLCKLGSFGGTDASAKSFAEGSTQKLAKACRKFMSNTGKDLDLRKWACEGLAYLTLDADVKEDLVDDTDAIVALIDLAKNGDQMTVYPAATVLVNVTNSYDKKDVEPEMVELAKYAKQHVPEDHPMDKKEYLDKRIEKLVNVGIVNALVALSKTESAMSRELVCRVFKAICENEKYRGLVVQQGGAKCLIPLALEGNDIAKVLAAQSLAKIGITMNPEVAFPGQRVLEVVRPLIQLLRIDMPALMNFEALMALTNLSSLNDSIRKKIIKEHGFGQIEHYMYEEHELLQRAATQCICNLVMCEDVLDFYLGDNDRVKTLVLFSVNEEDDKICIAASGALAALSVHKVVCDKIFQVKSWEEILCAIAINENLEIQHRACHVIMNIMESDKENCAKLVESKVLEVLMALSRHTDKKYDKVKECINAALKCAQNYDLIKENPEIKK